MPVVRLAQLPTATTPSTNEKINRDYGTDADFDQLLAEAQQAGHQDRGRPGAEPHGSGSSLVRGVGEVAHLGEARIGTCGAPTDLHWTQPWNHEGPTWHERGGAFYYGIFWSGDAGPQLPHAGGCAKEVKRIAALWAEAGESTVSAWTLRATWWRTGRSWPERYGPRRTLFWKEFAAHVRSVKPDRGADRRELGPDGGRSPRTTETRGAVPGGGRAAAQLRLPARFPDCPRRCRPATRPESPPSWPK